MKKSEHFFFRLSDPRCVEFLKAWTQDGRLQPGIIVRAVDPTTEGDRHRYPLPVGANINVAEGAEV